MVENNVDLQSWKFFNFDNGPLNVISSSSISLFDPTTLCNAMINNDSFYDENSNLMEQSEIMTQLASSIFLLMNLTDTNHKKTQGLSIGIDIMLESAHEKLQKFSNKVQELTTIDIEHIKNNIMKNAETIDTIRKIEGKLPYLQRAIPLSSKQMRRRNVSNAGKYVISPTITLIGNSSMSLSVGSDFTDPGAETNSIDNNITVESNVDVSSAGTYTIIYTATDPAGNTASVTRQVIIITTENELSISYNYN